MKFVCPVCGYVEEFDGDQLPEDFKCPQCGVPGSRFLKQEEGQLEWAAEHVVGVAKMEGVSEDIVADLRANFEGECSEVGMYLAMARVAHREGYPEIGLYWEKAAHEEAEHAAKFAELLGEVVTDSTKKNLEMRVEAENGATAGKTDLAKRAKAAGLDAILDTVHVPFIKQAHVAHVDRGDAPGAVAPCLEKCVGAPHKLAGAVEAGERVDAFGDCALAFDFGYGEAVVGNKSTGRAKATVEFA